MKGGLIDIVYYDSFVKKVLEEILQFEEVVKVVVLMIN